MGIQFLTLTAGEPLNTIEVTTGTAQPQSLGWDSSEGKTENDPHILGEDRFVDMLFNEFPDLRETQCL